MKQNGGDTVLVVASCRPIMAGLSPAQQSFPTPSPFSFSVASTGLSSRPSISVASLVLRFFTLVFSFVSAISLIAPSTKKKDHHHFSFTSYSGLLYFFIVSILVFVYSAFQLFKGVCDFAHRGILISDMVSDYMSFILDYMVGYLLVSSSSVAVQSVEQMGKKKSSLWEGTIIAIAMSFASFIVIAVCSLLSGYKLCKRIVW